MKSVYSAVRTGSLNKAVCASSLEGVISKRKSTYAKGAQTHVKGHKDEQGKKERKKEKGKRNFLNISISSNIS
jgi:hypothetical protein